MCHCKGKVSKVFSTVCLCAMCTFQVHSTAISACSQLELLANVSLFLGGGGGKKAMDKERQKIEGDQMLAEVNKNPTTFIREQNG